MKKTLVALLSLFMVACAGGPTVRMTDSDKEAIKTITINPNVTMPKEMFFSGRAQAFAMGIGGVLGAIIGDGMANEPKDQIVAVMQAKNISLPEIVKSEFRNQITKSGNIKIASTGTPADAELYLAVNVYGLGQTQGFSSLLYPVINISATLKRKDGTVVLNKTDFATPQNSENNIGKTFEEYMNNPELLKDTFTNISGIVSRMVLADP